MRALGNGPLEWQTLSHYMGPTSTLQGAPSPGEDAAAVRRAMRNSVRAAGCVARSEPARAFKSEGGEEKKKKKREEEEGKKKVL